MDQRNLILAVVFSVVILLAWQFLFETPRTEQERAAREAAEQLAERTQQPPRPGTLPRAPGGAGDAAPPSAADAPGAPPVPGVVKPKGPGRTGILNLSPRIALSSPRLRGSIRLKGARFDDLTLKDYRETIKPGSEEITLLSPPGAEHPYFAQFGWVAAEPNVKLPGPETVWKANRRSINPNTPVTLKWNNGEGLEFTRVVALDQNYLFTVVQRVKNLGTKVVTLFPYALISRTGTPDVLGFFILHEGLVGVFNKTLEEIDYSDLQEDGPIERATTGGWIGITDKYWLTALVPDQRTEVKARFFHTAQGKTDKYQVDFIGRTVVVQPGATGESSSRLFAGAKEVGLLDEYQEKHGIVRFDLAIDWGWLWFLTKPIFYVLDYFHGLMGNFGLAILLLTVLIKIAFFPLANKSYKAMSRLKKLQPEMTKIRERFKEDRARQQQEMMAMYKKENANPMSGCLPMVIQIPVFFALYKVLFVTIEMRHAPFYGWIKDLSAQDPTTLFNLFGLIPWDPPSFLAIGIWPLIMGGTMFLQQRLNPQPADPMQAKLFLLMPFIFTILLARFPAGLVIYWAWNNLLSITQQWVIMRRMGVPV